MRIEPTSYLPTNTVSNTNNTTNLKSPGVAKGAEGASPTTDTGFTPTSDLSKYLDAIRTTPDVRTEIVDEVEERLNAGELDTSAAAREAAAGILESEPPAVG